MYGGGVRRLPLSLALLLALPAAATNTDDDGELRVVLFDGTVYQGKVKLKKTQLEVVSGKRGKPRYRDIASIEDAPPPMAEELERARAQYQRKAAAVAEGDAAAWARLGKWAREQELEAEAVEAWQKAIALDPDLASARAALGFTKDGDGWVETAKLLEPELNKLGPKDPDGRVALAKRALKGGADELAFQLLRDALLSDQFHKDALAAMRPLTARYRQKIPLRLPIRGRWRASPDTSGHHGIKGFAVYALDLVKVDEQGKGYTGDGKQLEDHHSFGQPFYAAADGVVFAADNDHPDNPPFTIPREVRESAWTDVTHNGVALQHEGGEVTWYIHAKKGSIRVKVGDRVKQGDILGEVGNSGRSALPHLHFTLVNHGGLSVPWACDDFTLVAEDGTPLRVLRACPREGWTIESRDPEKK